MDFGLLFQRVTSLSSLGNISDSVVFLALSFILSVCFVWCRAPSNFKEKVCNVLYAASSLCVVFFSTNPVYVAIGFDIMALAAMCIIALGKDSSGDRAFIVYACVHFLSGALLVVGACQFTYLGYIEGIPKILFILGLLLNAAAFPMSSWVPYTYPKASRSGTIVLSTFTTKVAVYVLLQMIYEGIPLIQYVGIATALYGTIFAIFAKEIRLVMSYGVVGNVGLLLIVVGCGREVLPVDLVIMQMALSVMYQTLLFMVVDSIACDTAVLSKKGLWLNAACCMVALLNMCAFPGTASYILKSALFHIDTNNFSYAILRNVYPTCGLLLFMATGLKFYWGWIRCYACREDAVVGLRTLSTVGLASAILLLGVPGVWRGIFPEYNFAYALSDVISRVAIITIYVVCFVCFANKFTKEYEFALSETRAYRLFVYVKERVGGFLRSVRNIYAAVDDSSEVVSICMGSVSLKHTSGSEYTAGSTVLWSMLFILVVFVVWIYV